MQNMLTTWKILPLLPKIFPPLLPTSRKGDNGRVAVIGGSFQFTGAPFYSAISSLKVGGDLAHIFCSKSASPSIKSYSPEVIVHPVFVSSAEATLSPEELSQAHSEWLSKIMAWQPAIHSWVIGPGLGRDPYMNSFFPQLVKALPSGCLAVFDADGIYFLSQHPELMAELSRFRTILTPNARELTFLQKVYNIDIEAIREQNKSEEELQEISSLKEWPGFTLFVKGRQDIILGKTKSFIVRTQGGQKRCGGLGDLLAGAIAVCSLWNAELGPVLASRIVRMATKVAFEKQGRGLTAPCVVKQLSKIVQKIEASL